MTAEQIAAGEQAIGALASLEQRQELDDALAHPSTALVDARLEDWEADAFFTDARRAALEQSGAKPETLVRMRAYLAVFAERGIMTPACRLARVSVGIIQDWRVKYTAFVEMEQEARRHATDRLEAAALRRARDGVLKPIWQKGQFCGYERVYSDTLMVELLRASDPERFARRTKDEGGAKTGDAAQGAPIVSALRDRIRRLKRAAEEPEPVFDPGEATSAETDDYTELSKKFDSEEPAL